MSLKLHIEIDLSEIARRLGGDSASIMTFSTWNKIGIGVHYWTGGHTKVFYEQSELQRGDDITERVLNDFRKEGFEVIA